MAYVPGFECDLFISYARADDVDGWVDQFHSQLIEELSLLVGYKFSKQTVYLDKTSLRAGQDFLSELTAKARKSAVIVVLLSPSYAASRTCRIEMEAFQKGLPARATLHDCLAAVKLRDAQLPEYLRIAQCADFSKDESGPWPARSDEWFTALKSLAKGIRSMLQTLRSRAGAVFLGSSLHNDPELRARLADYVGEEHFRATPDHEALLDGPKECIEALKNAICAVHFIGGTTDLTRYAIENSIKYCKNIVLFKPHDAKVSKSEEQFLAEVFNSASIHLHRIEDNEIELQHSLRELLIEAKKKSAIANAALALICGRPDFPWARAFHVDDLSWSYPDFLDDDMTRTEEWRRWSAMVRNSHGLLFYHGMSDENVLTKVWDLAVDQRSPAERRWYLAEPDLQSKVLKRPAEPVYPEGLHDFLDKVRRAAEGRA
jgi:hypothetical protein